MDGVASANAMAIAAVGASAAHPCLPLPLTVGRLSCRAFRKNDPLNQHVRARRITTQRLRRFVRGGIALGEMATAQTTERECDHFMGGGYFEAPEQFLRNDERWRLSGSISGQAAL